MVLLVIGCTALLLVLGVVAYICLGCKINATMKGFVDNINSKLGDRLVDIEDVFASCNDKVIDLDTKVKNVQKDFDATLSEITEIAASAMQDPEPEKPVSRYVFVDHITVNLDTIDHLYFSKRDSIYTLQLYNIRNKEFAHFGAIGAIKFLKKLKEKAPDKYPDGLDEFIEEHPNLQINNT